MLENPRISSHPVCFLVKKVQYQLGDGTFTRATQRHNECTLGHGLSTHYSEMYKKDRTMPGEVSLLK